MISFTVLMQPTAKARARTVMHKGKVRTYTPSKTVEAEALIRNTYYEKFGLSERISKPLGVCLTCFFTKQKPKSAPKKREILWVTKPDWDNLGKTVCDALNCYAWEDDSQIVEVHLYKKYSDIPKIEIEISTLTP